MFSADASLYLKIYIYGFLFLYLYNICNGIFTSLGDSRTPLYFLIGSSISNILLDIFFVVWLKMGVAGVAWATFAAQGAASVLAFLTLVHRIKQLRAPNRMQNFPQKCLYRLLSSPSQVFLQQCFCFRRESFRAVSRQQLWLCRCCRLFCLPEAEYLRRHLHDNPVQRRFLLHRSEPWRS